MNELTTDPTIVALLNQSSQKETLMAVLLGVTATIWIVRQITPLIQWMKGEKKTADDSEWKEAVRIVNQKDIDGNSVFLGIPRMLREFTSTMQGFTGQLTHLVNHQSETLKRLDENANETLRLLAKMNQSTEKFQRDFRNTKH